MKKWLIWAIPAAILVALIAWRFTIRDKTQAGPGAGMAGGGRGGGAAVVEVATVKPRLIQAILQSVANVESPYKVDISPKSAGRIAYLTVREGDPVHKGEVLLKIDPSDLQGAVVQAEANVAEARSRLAQAKITQGATNVGITSQIKQQEASVGSARADLDQVQHNAESQAQTAQAQINAAASAVKNAEASLDKENANLKNAQVKYDRTYDLYQNGYIAAQDVDDAKTALEVERGAVAVAQGQLDAAHSQLDIQQQNLKIVQGKSRSDIADSKAKVTQAKANLSVATANRSQTPAYRENLAALQSSVDAALAALNQANSRLSDTTVRSPIDGTVTARNSNPGGLASPGSPVLEVQSLDWLYVTTSLPVEFSPEVRVGQMAQITFDSLPGRTFAAPITNVNPAADPQSRQFSVLLRLANPGHVLRPGMFGQVTLVTSQVDAQAVVPKEAVTTKPESGSTVTVVDDTGTAHVVHVKLGVSDSSGVQIFGGVQAGQKVVVLTYSPVRDGAKVKIADAGAQNKGAKRKSGAHKGSRP